MILFAEEALADLEHIFSFNLDFDSEWAIRQIELIERAVLILEEHPRIGRPVSGEIRELVISFGKAGYIALYQYEEVDHLVRILAVRHPREAGYRGR